MEAILTGTPQFIVTSIGLLITTAQSRYLLDVENAANKQLAARKNIKPFVRNWHLLLLGWWIHTIASHTGLIRILFSFFVEDEKEMQSLWFAITDFSIILAMLIGYALLAWVASRAWDWNKWRGHPFSTD